jgi:hypothetical protein
VRSEVRIRAMTFMALLLGRHYEFPQCGIIKEKLLLLLLLLVVVVVVVVVFAVIPGHPLRKRFATKIANYKLLLHFNSVILEPSTMRPRQFTKSQIQNNQRLCTKSLE